MSFNTFLIVISLLAWFAPNDWLTAPLESKNELAKVIEKPIEPVQCKETK